MTPAAAAAAAAAIRHSSRHVAVGRLPSARRASVERFTGGYADRPEQRVRRGAGTWARRRRPIRNRVIVDVKDQLAPQRISVVDRRPLLRHRRHTHLRILHHTHDRLADSQEQARQRSLEVSNPRTLPQFSFSYLKQLLRHVTNINILSVSH